MYWLVNIEGIHSFKILVITTHTTTIKNSLRWHSHCDDTDGARSNKAHKTRLSSLIMHMLLIVLVTYQTHEHPYNKCKASTTTQCHGQQAAKSLTKWCEFLYHTTEITTKFWFGTEVWPESCGIFSRLCLPEGSDFLKEFCRLKTYILICLILPHSTLLYVGKGQT
jgi:hypothetical protein